jgi:enoyl reductase-like protein
VFIVLPLWAIIDYLTPQMHALLDNREKIIEQFNLAKAYMGDKPLLKEIDLSDEALMGFLQSLTRYIPRIVNSVLEEAHGGLYF